MTNEELHRLAVGAFAPPSRQQRNVPRIHRVRDLCDVAKTEIGAAGADAHPQLLLRAEHALREALQIIETLKESADAS